MEFIEYLNTKPKSIYLTFYHCFYNNDNDILFLYCRSVPKKIKGGLFGYCVLKDISKKTGGLYYRATSLKELESIYESINTLEKTKFDESITVSYELYYHWVLIPSLIVFLLSWILKHTFYKTILY